MQDAQYRYFTLPEPPAVVFALAHEAMALSSISVATAMRYSRTASHSDAMARVFLWCLMDSSPLREPFTACEFVNALCQCGHATDLTDAGLDKMEAMRGDAAAVPAPEQKTTKRTLADRLGVTVWHELEVYFLLWGLLVKKHRTPGTGRKVLWDDLGWGADGVENDERIRWLGQMAAADGKLKEHNDQGKASRRTRMCADLCQCFGITGGTGRNPLFYKTGHSQTRFTFSMGRDVLREEPGKCRYDEKRLEDNEGE